MVKDRRCALGKIHWRCMTYKYFCMGVFFCLLISAHPSTLEKRLKWWGKNFDAVQKRHGIIISEDSVYIHLLINYINQAGISEEQEAPLNDVKRTIADLITLEHMLYIALLKRSTLRAYTKKDASLAQWSSAAHLQKKVLKEQTQRFVDYGLLSPEEINFACSTLTQFLHDIKDV